MIDAASAPSIAEIHSIGSEVGNATGTSASAVHDASVASRTARGAEPWASRPAPREPAADIAPIRTESTRFRSAENA